MANLSVSTNPASADLTEQYRAKEAQKQEVQQANEKEIENLKKAYELQKAELVDRFETAVQSDQTKHYENLKNMKRQSQRSEDDLAHKKD